MHIPHSQLINIKKYLGHRFSTNKIQLKDTSDVCYIKLSYISNPSHHIKNKLLKLSVKKILTLSYFLIHSKLKIVFHIKTQLLRI